MSVAVIVGSAFDDMQRELERVEVETRFGTAVVHRASRGWVVFRHGRPHHLLPNQIPYRANVLALRALGAQSVVVTSSVGVLNPAIPMLTPLLLGDLAWFGNRLPDGSAATLFPQPHPEQGHLVLQSGVFDERLGRAIRRIAAEVGVLMHPDPVDFWYAPGPRTKTRLENRILASWGLDVNSMTVAPEVVLAAEAGMTVAGVVVGHKPSGPGMGNEAVAQSLVDARQAMERLVDGLLDGLEPEPAVNPLYQYR